VIYQKVAFLSNFTSIYIGKQKTFVLKKIKQILKKNKSLINYPNKWKILKVKNIYYYKDKRNLIRLNTKYIYSKGLNENIGLAIKIALDLNINKKIIIKTIPKIKFQARLEYITKGKLIKKLHKNEKLLIDGCHSETSAKNLASYLKTLKIPVYGIWSMTKNKDPDNFIKQFKGIFKKIITVPIENETASLSNSSLFKIAKKNNFYVDKCNNFEMALKKIKSSEKKIICIFGSLYLCGKFLSKN